MQNITFQRANFDELDAAPESFDAVLGLSIIHLMQDPEAAIARAFRLLKPGGVFVTSTVCIADGLWFLVPVIPLMQLFGLAPHVKFLSARRLRKSMETAGFTIEYEWWPKRSKALFLVCRKPG